MFDCLIDKLMDTNRLKAGKRGTDLRDKYPESDGQLVEDTDPAALVHRGDLGQVERGYNSV